MNERSLREEEVRALTKVLDYFYGRGAGDVLRRGKLTGLFSKRTRRLQRIFLNGKVVFVVRASDFAPLLTREGVRLIGALARRIVVVRSEVKDIVKRARNVFCRHVVRASDTIKPRDEVIVVSEDGDVLAVGRAVLPGKYMTRFKSGIAVMVRRGIVDVPYESKRA